MKEETTYTVENVEEILKLVNKDNVNMFTKDFTTWLKLMVKAKDEDKPLYDSILNKTYYKWIDDGKNDIVLTLVKPLKKGQSPGQKFTELIGDKFND